MIGTSRAEYWFIRFCIFGLYFIAPICIAYCVLVVALYGVKATRYPFPLLVEVGAVAETLAFFLFYLPWRKYLRKDAVHPPALDRARRQELFALCNANIPDHEAYIQKWFLYSDLAEIRRENLKEFFLWAFFNRGGPPGADDEELEDYIVQTERHLNRKVAPGRGNAQCLRLTLDKPDMLHRSIIWYWCVGFVDFLTFMSLLRHGFTFYRTSLSRFFTLIPLRPQVFLARNKSPAKHLTYWHRPHTSKTKLPILFIHGIGIGLYPYVNLLNELNSTAGLEPSDDPNDQVGIIAIELMPVSFRITHPALPKDTTCAEIAQILHHHGWSKVVLVSHSYGSVVSTHLLKHPSTRPLIGPLVLIDPVSILLHLPDVAYNFTRRRPVRANEHQLYYFASMDIGVAHTLARHFFWSENVLWKKDVGDRDVTVSLGGRDLIVNTEAVGTYLGNGEDFCLTPGVASPEKKTNGSVANGHGGAKALGNAIENGHGKGADRDLQAWKRREWSGTGIDVLWFSELDHAQVFDKRATRAVLIKAIREYCVSGMKGSGVKVHEE